MFHSRVAVLMSSVSLLFVANAAQSAGFYIQEQSVSGLGNAYAGQVAKPRDSSIVYYNPAAMTQLDGNGATFGVHIIAPSADLSDTGTTNGLTSVGPEAGNPYDPTPVPNFSMAYEVIEDKLWLGVSAGAPFGLSNDYGKEWFGRYDSTDSDLAVHEAQPSFAYKVNDKLSVGGGINIQSVDVDLGSVINLGPTDLNSTLEGDDSLSVGYNVGLLYQPLESTVLGVHYRSSVKHQLDGDVAIDNNGTFVSGYEAAAKLALPDILQLGVDHKINDKWSVQAGATWFGWNSFDEIRVIDKAGVQADSVTVQNYQTTWAFAVGAEYILDDKWTLRAGYQFDETPTTDLYRTSRTPDGDRQWFAAGATYEINDKLSLDLAAVYIDVAEEDINVSRNASLVNVRAKADQEIGIFSLGLNYKF